MEHIFYSNTWEAEQEVVSEPGLHTHTKELGDGGTHLPSTLEAEAGDL